MLGETRVADWVDLLTPFAVLGSVAVVLDLLAPTGGRGRCPGLGAVLFTLGHGLHLAANPVSKVADEAVARPIVHLWDEAASHYIWYVGLFLVMGSVALALRGELRAIGGLDLSGEHLHRGGYPWLGVVLPAVGLGTGRSWRPIRCTGCCASSGILG